MIMILIMKILLHNEYKIIILWYPTYVYQFLIFFIITTIECWPVFKQDPGRAVTRHSVFYLVPLWEKHLFAQYFTHQFTSNIANIVNLIKLLPAVADRYCKSLLFLFQFWVSFDCGQHKLKHTFNRKIIAKQPANLPYPLKNFEKLRYLLFFNSCR